MNIQEAKIEIRNTLRAYTLKDENGKYRYPVSRQRPILLMGPPGIGKTAILEQVAAQSNVGLVSYSLTHHTRQSAVGLPHIEEVSYEGRKYSVTEYTMSEIIASIYSYMAETGRKEGILFLDEVNCVSETLAPTMLQLLQNKTFGSHQVPEGWIIVTAGNPPEYNKSVREFDVATLDRVRTISIEADCGIWMEYARQQGVHSAILSYLSICPEHFYRVEDRAEGPVFVTARGWEDLSELLKSYEILEVPVGKELIRQFLQCEEVAEKFSAYYGLYRKYDEDYGIDRLLEGRLSEDGYAAKAEMARAGSFEERFTVVQLLMDGLESGFRRHDEQLRHVEALYKVLKRLPLSESLETAAQQSEHARSVRLRSGMIDEEQSRCEKWVIERLKDYDAALKRKRVADEGEKHDCIRRLFSEETRALDELSDAMTHRLSRAFRYAEDCFGDGQEMILFVTDLAHSAAAMNFIAECGSPEFLRHAGTLLFHKQEKILLDECRELMKDWK